MFLDDASEPGTVKSGKEPSLAAEASHPLDAIVASTDKPTVAETSDDGRGVGLRLNGTQFSRLSREISNGLTNLMGIFDGTIYKRLNVGGVWWDA